MPGNSNENYPENPPDQEFSLISEPEGAPAWAAGPAAADGWRRLELVGDSRCTCRECIRFRLLHGTREFSAEGYDQDGYDRDGYGRDGRDIGGYDRDGVNEDGYDRAGNPVSVPAGDLDLRELWTAFLSAALLSQDRRRTEFLAYLRKITCDPDAIGDVCWCDGCGWPAWNAGLSMAHDDTRICDTCWASWYDCDICGCRYPDGGLRSLLNDDAACNSCIDSHCSFCDYCNGWHADEDAGHDHDDDNDDGRCDSCCDSPQPEFTVRNNGSGPLANDTPAEITLPAGIISAEGLKKISDYLLEQSRNIMRIRNARLDPTLVRRSNEFYDLAFSLDSLGDEWQTRNGNYPKRLSQHAHRTRSLKLTPEDMSRIGTIARDHCGIFTSMRIEVTRDLNRPPEDFAHAGSCWWTDYSSARCALKTNGGFGLRSFGNYGVAGRAWVMPLRQQDKHLTPTFRTLSPDALVVFNGYGNLRGYAAPRILAHMTGWTYRKIRFSCSPMYVNSGSGYLVAPEKIAEDYAGQGLDLDVRQHSTLFERETADVSTQ